MRLVAATVPDCGHQTLFTGTSANWLIVYLASSVLKLGMHAVFSLKTGELYSAADQIGIVVSSTLAS